jgi:murein DD-endopeptidase MepM/ murein hydrolase activator NlpD
MNKHFSLITALLVCVGMLMGACLPANPAASTTVTPEEPVLVVSATPLPTRGPHSPGQIFEYLAQSGDTLPAIASHFNTTEDEIRAENPDLPDAITTLPNGYPLLVPAYYSPLTGSTFHILPDSEVVNGPSAVSFDIRSEVLKRAGFLTDLDTFAYKRQREAWQVVEIISLNYSINPRLLLALLEHQSQALSLPFPDADERTYPMGVQDRSYRGLFWQLLWAAERINDGYYGWRSGSLKEIELADGLIVQPDPWQNAGTVALYQFFAGLYGKEAFEAAVSPEGFYQTYLALWGEPFAMEIDLIPASLQQPELGLPFVPNSVWDFTGGPHPAWGTSLPFGALDFAPPSEESGCVQSKVWFTAPADGVIARSAEATVILDLDGDGDERTGWVLFFFHVATEGRIAEGVKVKKGDLLGFPSCEGGISTGTHIHVARRYNGEWIPAAGTLAFVLDGWVAEYGGIPYEGTLTKGSKVVPACKGCARAESQIIYTLPE